MDAKEVFVDCYDGDGGEAFFLVDRLGKFSRSGVSVNKVNYEGRVEDSQDSFFCSCLLVSASAFRMTAWALCQSSLERVLVPAIACRDVFRPCEGSSRSDTRTFPCLTISPAKLESVSSIFFHSSVVYAKG